MVLSFIQSTTASLTLALGAASASSASDNVVWYLTRTAAISSYIVLAILVALGLVQGYARRAGERLWWMVEEAHKWLGTLFAALTALHILSLLADPYISFSWLNLVLPLDEPYRPLAVGLGVVALWSMVLVLGTSWLRRHLPHYFWRAFHYFSFVTFVLVTVHGVLAGTDTSETWMFGVYLVAGAVVALLTLLRLFPRLFSENAPAPSRAR
jgi:sulfoxide reductase heme-binding subunit YedZ